MCWKISVTIPYILKTVGQSVLGFELSTWWITKASHIYWLPEIFLEISLLGIK